MTLKVGDKVRFIEDYNVRSETRRVRVGEVGVVRGLGATLRVDLGPGREDIAVYRYRLEKVEEPAFKVGDKVKTNHGDVGTVVALRGKGFFDVRVPGQRGASSVTPGAGTYQQHNLEKIEEPTPKFKVGDRVRLDSPHYFCEDEVGSGRVYHEAPEGIGSTGTVKNVNLTRGPGQHIRVQWSSNGKTSVIAPSCLTLLPESVPFKLERGDKVVNRKTGRRGFVAFGVVYDEDDPFTEGVPVKAIEEYEEHYPGTYDLIKKDAPW